MYYFWIYFFKIISISSSNVDILTSSSIFGNVSQFFMNISNDLLLNYLYLFLIGIAVGFMNVIAGGGSVFVLPFLIFMGLDTTTANGTNRLGVMMQTYSAVATYKKDFLEEYKISWQMSLLTIPGAIAGALLALNTSNEMFEIILGVIMIFVVINMVFTLNIKQTQNEINKLPKLMYFYMLLIGFYGGFIQVGIGFILMFVVSKVLHKNLVKTNFHKSFIVLIYTVPSFLIFVFNGNIDWVLGIILGIGSSIGSFLAVKSSLKNGEKIIKPIMIISILIIVAKLFKLF